MERFRLNLNNDHSVGLGDNLCLISALANVPPGVDLYVNNDHDTFNRLNLYKRIFRISDSQLTINETDINGDFNNVGWPIKLFSEYYRSDYVNLKGKTYKASTPTEKKCIAVCCSVETNSQTPNQWPWVRARHPEYWGKIFAWIKSIGYDVITVDNPYFDLEDKIEMLVRHCKAIISYEGGMAHLAHMLNLPCFIVDWNHPSPSTTLGKLHCDFVHRTDSVHILRTDDELFHWNHDTFNQRISELSAGKTNNTLLDGTNKLSFTGPGIFGNTMVRNSAGDIVLNTQGLFSSKSTASQFLNKFYG